MAISVDIRIKPVVNDLEEDTPYGEAKWSITYDIPCSIVTTPRGGRPPVLKDHGEWTTWRKEEEEKSYTVELSISEAEHFSKSIEPAMKKSIERYDEKRNINTWSKEPHATCPIGWSNRREMHYQVNPLDSWKRVQGILSLKKRYTLHPISA